MLDRCQFAINKIMADPWRGYFLSPVKGDEQGYPCLSISPGRNALHALNNTTNVHPLSTASNLGCSTQLSCPLLIASSLRPMAAGIPTTSTPASTEEPSNDLRLQGSTLSSKSS